MSYCKWDKISELYKRYHDEEWGIPLRDDQMQFEFLMMEARQCGLSWKLMLQKREIFRKCFDNFDYEKVARYDEFDVERIMNIDGMIKSRRKIEAVINNAGCFQKISEEFGSFCEFLWSYSDEKTILYEDRACKQRIIRSNQRRYLRSALENNFGRKYFSNRAYFLALPLILRTICG